MKAIRIGPHTVLAGVEWLASQAATQKEAIDEALIHDPAKKYGITLEGVEAFAVGMTAKSEKAVVGAAWLADSQKDDGDFVLIEPLDGGEYWLCAIKNGIPFYGSDLVGSARTIEQEARTLLMSGGFRLITPDEQMGQSLGAMATSYTAAGFEATVKGKGNFKVKLLKDDKKLLLIVVGSMLALGVAYFGYSMYDEYATQQKAIAMSKAKNQAKQQQEQQARAAAQAEVNAAKDKLMQEQLASIQSALTAQGGLEATSRWAGVANNLRADTAGWNYTEAICDNKGCSFLLAPQDGATNKELFKLFPGASLDEKGNAEIKLPVQWPTSPVTIAQLRTKGQFIIDGISQFQDLKGLGFPVTWTAPADVVVNVLIPAALQNNPMAAGAATAPGVPMPAVKAMESVSVGVTKGTFKIDGVSLWALDGISKRLTSPEIVYEKLVMSFEPSNPGSLKSWSLEGSYYAKP
jgi:hypothetical protein